MGQSQTERRTRAVQFSPLGRLLDPAAAGAGPGAGPDALAQRLQRPEEPPAGRVAEPARGAPAPAAAQAGYAIRVRKDGVEFEVHGDRAFVLSESRRLYDLLLRGEAEPAVPSPAEGQDSRLREALLQFLGRVSVSGHPETVLALCAWMQERGLAPVGVSDIESCYELLGLPASSNFNADLNSLVRRKLLAEAPGGHGGRKAWVPTEHGLAFLHEKIRTS